MKVEVTGPRSVDFKGKIYIPGERLELPDAEARRLAALGVVKAAKAADEKPPAKPAAKDAAKAAPKKKTARG